MLDAGAWYHVVNRGSNRQRILVDARDYEHFLVKTWAATETPLKERRRYLRQYRWSSYPAYLVVSGGLAALVCDAIKANFSGKGNWRRAYARFVEEGLLDNVENPFEQVRGQAVLGAVTLMAKSRRTLWEYGVKDTVAQGSARRVQS